MQSHATPDGAEIVTGNQPGSRSKSAPALRIMMLGLRGFPDVQGGVETHAQHLCSGLVRLGYDVEVLVRSPYVPAERPRTWQGIRLTRVWAPRSRSLETIVHTFLGVLVAIWKRPDVLHIHAIGPAIFVPLARLFGLHVVVTTHGEDYQREKWGPLGRTILRLGERNAALYAHRCIAISPPIRDNLVQRYGIRPAMISNGVFAPKSEGSTATLEKFGLKSGRYVLMVARFAEEKRQLDLVQAFGRAGLEGWKLVLVGGADHRSTYSDSVRRLASETPGVVVAGVQVGEALAQLFSHAGLFVLPSSHEGLPIVLVEALGYGLPTIASDIPANRQVGLAQKAYFPVGDIDVLTERLREFSLSPTPPEEREATRQRVLKRHDWSNIARQTLEVYRSALGMSARRQREV